MSTSDLSVVMTPILYALLLTAEVFATPSLSSSKNAASKSDIGYYHPAEPDYPPMTAFPPSGKLPASSRFDLENPKNEESAMSKSTNAGKIYGGRLLVRVSSVPHPDNFKRDDEREPQSGSLSNPASYYLHGAHFQKIKTPRCHLTSCHGPYPNDGSLLINKDKGASNEECQQTFVQMNGCVGDKGYPIGMVCTICCQCTKQFVREMRHSRGFLENIN